MNSKSYVLYTVQNLIFIMVILIIHQDIPKNAKEIFTDKIELIEFGELYPRLYTSIHLLKDWISTREAQLKNKL